MVAPDPDNRFVLATDLAQDRIYVYAFDSTTGKLTPAATPFASLPSGDGPRHFAFHPNRRWMYLAEEEASTLVFFHYDEATGALSAQQTISALPPGFELPAKHVIHCVGPIYRQHGEGAWLLLASCYRNALRLCREHGLRSIAFPSISTGAYGCPVERAAQVALEAIRDELTSVMVPTQVRMVLFDTRTLRAYQQAWRALTGS